MGEIYCGKYAYDLNPKIFRYFKTNAKIIAVTATNGKTMTNNAIVHMLKEAGNIVVSNLEGNNMETGILSTLLKKTSLLGHIKADYMVFEVDEGYVPVIFKDFKLDTLIISNFFRDQLDRNGEVETLILRISEFLKTFSGNLVLNSDDPNVARLSKSNCNNKNVTYFSVDKYAFASIDMKEAGEGKFCPFCNERLEYEYYQYSHIGKFKCSNCGYGTNEVDIKITNTNLAEKTFVYEEITYNMNFNSIYAIYNFAAVISASKIYNIPSDIVKKSISTFILNNGRMEELVIKNCKTIINLAKNPTGVNVSLRLLNEDTDTKELLFVLNDNIADGKDVSWIWDINFDNLKDVSRIITSGTRALDIAIRIKTANYPKCNILPFTNLKDAIDELYSTQSKKYVIANYTALQPTRKIIQSIN